MTPTEILHKIVDTENKARTIYDEALAMQTGFDEYVQSRIEGIRGRYAQQEEQDVAAAENKAVSQAESEISRLDQKLETELTAAKNKYENRQDSFADKIFRLAVNLDA